jgi:hypothetical protein
MQVLLFQAIGMPDGSLVVPPPFTTEGVASPPGEGPADLEVELLDAAGAVLVRQRVAFASPCAMPAPGRPPAEPPPRLAQALIAHHAKARTLRVSQWGRSLHERTVKAAPAIDVAWPAAGALAGAELKLAWSCADAAVFGLWQFSNDGRNWTPLSLPQPAGSCGVDLRMLPGGKACRLRLLACDGVQTHRIDSKPFALKPRGWVSLLLAPADGSRIASDQPIELVGQGFEIEKREAEFDKLGWASSIDGDLGSGHRRRVRLSNGKHLITLTVHGRSARSVSVVVG